MLTPGFSFSPSLTLAAISFGIVMAALSPASLAGAPEVVAKATPPTIEGSSLDPAATYKQVDLKELVAKSRTEVPGQRIIFAPSPIMFRATLASLPTQQKADYLLAALSMMKISNPPKVTQRIGLEYGGDKAIAAYIDDSVAERMSKDAKTGQALTFYAFHVYNYSRGPALLITSYER
jgi:hypothetical protein